MIKPPLPLRRLWVRLFPKREAPSRAYVRRGDDARARQDWAAAASAYRAAVEVDPSLVAIWIQLGHALKEQNKLAAAAEAYAEAARQQPRLAEAHIFLAHIYKQLGRTDQSIVHFVKGLHAGERGSSQATELLRLMAQRGEKGRSALISLLGDTLDLLPTSAGEAPMIGHIRRIIAEPLAPPAPDDHVDGRSALVFDISDLISYYNNARLPTGIQRVQIETIEGALARAGDREIRLCCFIEGRENWLELPLERMRAIARLSTAAGDRFDPIWLEALADLRLFLSLTAPFEFPRGASLINLGTSWWLQNYFLFVRDAKATRGIRYIPFVHDMIPIMAPEHCTRALTQDFISWAIGVFDHADHFLCNSNATKRDLIKVAEMIGRSLDPDDIAVIPLDTEFRKPGIAELPDDALGQWSLHPDGFVLFVSTIESRKGHLDAFDAWVELIDQLGGDAVPQLVCVGNRGWLNDQIYDRLANDERLAAKVSMLSKLSDEELSLLYRTCLFTLYPSLYEGWGLPVTESLGHGKVPLVSDAASLPEAGGPFAVYFRAGATDELTAAARKLILDAAYRHELETKIATEFRPRAWQDLAFQISEELNRFADRDAHKGIVMPPPLTARPGHWHPLTRNDSTRIWPNMRTGESFRSNLGWYWPEDRGCRVRHEGGRLSIRLAGPHSRLHIVFWMGGDERGLSLWSVRLGDRLQEGGIPVQDKKWVTFEIPAADATHEIEVAFDALPADDGVVITYFVRGFFIYAADDSGARQAFIEAVALNQLDSLDAFGEDDGARPTG